MAHRLKQKLPKAPCPPPHTLFAALCHVTQLREFLPTHILIKRSPSALPERQGKSAASEINFTVSG